MSEFTTTSSDLNLRVMGFCGVDDSVSPEHIQLLSTRYTWIEWGFLFRPDKEGEPRYASMEWVRKMASVNSETGEIMRLAGHLCGSRCQEVLEGDPSFVEELSSLGFGRVQVNATAANNVLVDPTKFTEYANNLIRCMNAVSTVEWIFQSNDETKPILDHLLVNPPQNMSVLFDASCGLGKEISEFPVPFSDPEIPCGYAGGIGPSTIQDILTGVSRAARGKSVWVDMESSLRVTLMEKNGTTKDVFSLDKCFECILMGTKNFNMPVSRFTILSI